MFWYRAGLSVVKWIYRCWWVLSYSQVIGCFTLHPVLLLIVILMVSHTMICEIHCGWYTRRLVWMTCDIIRYFCPLLTSLCCMYPCLKLLIVVNILIAEMRVKEMHLACLVHMDYWFLALWTVSVSCYFTSKKSGVTSCQHFGTGMLTPALIFRALLIQVEQSVGFVCLCGCLQTVTYDLDRIWRSRTQGHRSEFMVTWENKLTNCWDGWPWHSNSWKASSI